MRRTNIYLTRAQCAALDALAADEGTSRAEVVRRLIDRSLAGDDASLTDDLAAVDESFGAAADMEVNADRSVDGRAAHLRAVAGPAGQ